jgi:hypothetical protein
MQARQAATDAVNTDWILYVSADEIMNSYNAGETVSAAIERVDAAGYEVIDFNEFVFLPIELSYIPDHEGFQPMRHYYFFEPHRPRLMRARMNRLQVSHVTHGGHVLAGEPFKLSPETFALRHTSSAIKHMRSRNIRTAHLGPKNCHADGTTIDTGYPPFSFHSHL